jgi:hypothetical protein
MRLGRRRAPDDDLVIGAGRPCRPDDVGEVVRDLAVLVCDSGVAGGLGLVDEGQGCAQLGLSCCGRNAGVVMNSGQIRQGLACSQSDWIGKPQ